MELFQCLGFKSVATSIGRRRRMIKDLWYKNAVLYCLSIGTYMDANADGIGDFQGLMRRLDYLHGPGITAIWLMPFQKSPGKDDGYDISDYYAVNPAYGSIGDFVEFTHGAKQRGIRVIIDLVVNHTSNEHPWFQMHGAIRNPNTATGISGRRSVHHTRTREWFSPAYKNPPGLMIPLPSNGISTVSTISSLISIRPIRRCRPRF